MNEEKSFEILFKGVYPERIVYEYDYKRIASQYLGRIAKERELSEKDIEEILDDPKSLCSLVGNELDELFSAVITKNDKTRGHNVYGYEGAPKEKYFRWFHRREDQILKEIFSCDIAIDKGSLQLATARYINNKDMLDDWLDWYCADLFCYNEYIETLKVVNIKNYGLIAYLMLGSKNWFIKIAGYAISVIFFLIKWSAWLFIMGVLIDTGENETWANIAAGLFLLVTIFSQFNKWQARKKINELLNSMSRAYAVLSTPTFSWEILWAALDDSRKLGAIWPGELWKLVELRRPKKIVYASDSAD